MKYRKKLNKKSSNRTFKKGMRTNVKNINNNLSRGGIRL